MKQLFVQLAGIETQPVEISIMPGVTAGEIVRQLELPGFCLCVCDVTPRFFRPEKEVPYDELTEGATLYAVVLPEVARMYLRSPPI